MSSSAIFADNGNGDVNSSGDVNTLWGDETKGAVRFALFSPVSFYYLIFHCEIQHAKGVQVSK